MSNRREVLKYFKEQKEYMDKRVSEGIEKYRKGGIKINVVDKNGNPVKNAKIKAELTNHEFNFGANIFMLDTLVDVNKEPERWKKDFASDYNLSEFTKFNEWNVLYKEYFKDLCNYAVLPFYWDELEPEKGKPRYFKDEPHIHRRPAPMQCVKFCNENNIRKKVHCLNYDGHDPKWVQELTSSEEIKAQLDYHFKECAEIFADEIKDWEVTNETLVLYPNPCGETCFLKDEDFVSWSFNTAKKYFKDKNYI